MINKDQENGDVEIEIKEIKVLSEAETLLLKQVLMERC